MEKMAATEKIETRGNTYYHVETQNVVDSADQRTSHPSPPKLQKGRLFLAQQCQVPLTGRKLAKTGNLHMVNHRGLRFLLENPPLMPSPSGSQNLHALVS
jgi:hypothetical protein